MGALPSPEVSHSGSPSGSMVMQQSAELGQTWGARVGARVAERIRAAAKQKGYEL